MTLDMYRLPKMADTSQHKVMNFRGWIAQAQEEGSFANIVPIKSVMSSQIMVRWHGQKDVFV